MIRWLKVAVNVGILVGIVFLIAEVRRNLVLAESRPCVDRDALALQIASPDVAQIVEKRAASNAAIKNHDAIGVVAHLAPEYQIATGSGELFHGSPEQERVDWDEIFRANDDVVYVRSPEEIQISDYLPRAAERGTWVGSWSGKTGAIELGGSYSATWSKIGETWKIRSEEFVTLYCRGAGC